MNSFFRCFIPAVTMCLLATPDTQAQIGNNNPNGVAGDYNGSITTGGSYDPFTGNASRAIDDIVVAGSVGAYPLAWTRRMNTRAVTTLANFGHGGGWSHSYQWELSINHPAEPTPPPIGWPPDERPDGVLVYPDGRTVELDNPWEPDGIPAADESPFGKGDRFIDRQNGNYDLLLADGGVVKFHKPSPSQPRCRAEKMVDPYGQEILFQYSGNRLDTISEPGSNPRYLKLTYGPHTWAFGTLTFLDKVEAYDGLGNVTQSVSYTYELKTFREVTLFYLTRATYNNNPLSYAAYTYQEPNRVPLYPDDLDGKNIGLISTCNDLRFAGPMKRIKYEFRSQSLGHQSVAWGEIFRERSADNNSIVSELQADPPEYPPDPDFSWRREHRPDGSTREFGYHISPTYLKHYTDFEGHWAENSITYDSEGVHCEFKDQLQHVTKKLLSGDFGLTKRVTHPDLSYSEITYSNQPIPNYIATARDERGHIVEFVRYPNHRIQRVNYPQDPPDGPDYPGNGCELFSYNTLGQIETHQMTNGATQNFRYDNRGLKTLFWPPPTPSDMQPDQNPTRYFYYTAANSPGRFDRIDRLWYVQDPLGHTTTYDYNDRGQITRITHHDNTFTQSQYHDDGTLAWTADENHPNASMPGHEHERTRYQYDAYKRVTHVTKPGIDDPAISDYTPRAGGVGPLSHTTSSVYRATSPFGRVTGYDYDGNFRRTMMIEAPGIPDDEATTIYRYDLAGNLEWTDDPRLNRTAFGYDDRNRRTSVTNVALGETTVIGYDAVGNKTSETREQDSTLRSWDYDSLNRLYHAYDWRANPVPNANQTTTYRRDCGGNVTGITDTKGAVYTYEYDGMNRKTRATYPHDTTVPQRTETWEYDLAGNPYRYKNPGDQHKRFHHDSRNRLDHTWWEEPGVGQDIVTVYDHASRITRVATNGEETVIAFGYDDADRKLWEEQTLMDQPMRRVETDPNADGYRATLAVPGLQFQDGSDYSFTYQYTMRNQLKSINRADSVPVFAYVYDVVGNMTKRNGVFNNVNDSINCPTTSYDALNRPTTWEQTGASDVPFARSHYRYDHANRQVATWRDEDFGHGDGFIYDPTNQLKRADYDAPDVSQLPPTAAARTVHYGYTDDRLNRLTMTDSGVVTHYVPNMLNQYTTVEGATYAYNGNFNLTAAPGFTATYDAANHLISATNNQQSVEFLYDGLGRCVRRTINEKDATIFTYDGWKPIAEWDEWGNFKAWNLYGPGADEILLRYQVKMGYIRFHTDPHGNVTFLLDNDGAIREKCTYDAFGKPTITQWSSGETPSTSWYGHEFLFQGRQYIGVLGIYDYRNRFYHPRLGRFLQVDPLGLDGGDMNLYRYCGDDPVDLSDPTGTSWLTLGRGGIFLPYFREASITMVVGYGVAAVAITAMIVHETTLPMMSTPHHRPATYPANGRRRREEIYAAPPPHPGENKPPDDPGEEPQRIRPFNPMEAPPKILRPPRVRLGFVASSPMAAPQRAVLFGHRPGGPALFNDGSGWAPIGSASANIRWSKNSGTGNWQADQFVKYYMMDSGPQAGEGTHPVPFNLR